MIVISDPRWAEFRKAVDEALIGGNHLVGVLSEDWPSYTVSAHEALTIIGPGQAFDAWCGWAGIMRLRDAWDELTKICDPAPSGGSARTMD